MKPSFCFLAALFLLFAGAVFSPTSAQSDDNPGAEDDDAAQTTDDKKKYAGLFDDMPGIAAGGRGGEFTISFVLPSEADGGAAKFGVIVAGRITFVDNVCFDQPTVIHVEEELILQSRNVLSTKNLHIIVRTGGKLVIRAPAVHISREDKVSDWPLLMISGTVIFEPSGSMEALLDGSLKDQGDVVLVAREDAVFLSDQDIVRYPSTSAMTVSRMIDAETGDGHRTNPHRHEVELRHDFKASMESIRAMGNAKSRVPSSATSTGPSSLTNSDFNDGATACSTNTSPNTGPYTANLVGGQRRSRSSSSDGTAYKNKKTNHGNHQDGDGTSDMDDSKDNTEPDHTSPANPVSTSTPSDERSDDSTAHHDHHGHHRHPDHHDHHHRRQHPDDIDTSGKYYPEPASPASAKVPSPSPTASNVHRIDSTPPEASGNGRNTQPTQVRRSTRVDEFFFELAIAWLALEIDSGHRGAAEDCGGSYSKRGVDATGGGWVRPRSTSGRRHIHDDHNTSGLRHPEPAISFHVEIKRPLLTSRPDILVEKDGLSIVVEKNPETTLSSSSSSSISTYTEVVGNNSEMDGGKRVSPPAAAAAAAAAAARTGTGEVPDNDVGGKARLLQATNVLDDMRRKADAPAATPAKGGRGTQGWTGWRSRQRNQGQTSAGGRLSEREAALGEKKRLGSTVEATKVEPESGGNLREQRVNNRSPWGRSKYSEETRNAVRDNGRGPKSGERTIWGITADDVMD